MVYVPQSGEMVGYTRLGVSKANVILAPITQSEIGVALINPS